jgi:hypothetical protein
MGVLWLLINMLYFWVMTRKGSGDE